MNERKLSSLRKILAGSYALFLGVVLCTIVHHFFFREVIIFEKMIDGSGSKALITCRPDAIHTSNGYLVIKRWHGLEVARVELPGKGYDTVSECRATIGVVDLSVADREQMKFWGSENEMVTKMRLHFGEKRAGFAGAEYVDVSISFFAWEER